MTGYVCEHCPLAFEVGYYVYWDLSGGCVKYVCRYCGTMHKIEHKERLPDMLYALDGPIRAMVEVPLHTCVGESVLVTQLPITEDSWRLVGPLPTAETYLRGFFVVPHRAQAVRLDRLACVHCGRIGGLVSREWPLDADAKWPSFGDQCPVCQSPLRWVYIDTIN